MSPDPYSPLVRQLFANPAHAGTTKKGSSVALEAQGVRLRLSAAIRGDRVASLRFLAWGCPHFIAACEHFCSRYEGGPGSALARFQAADIIRDLPVPVEKTGRILVLEDAVRSLEQKICGGAEPT